MKIICILLVMLFLVKESAAQWFQQNSGTSNILLSVHFPSRDTGYAAGAGIILKTTDGGSNWIQQNSGTSDFIRSIYFPSTNIGFAVGDQGIIFKTNNGGATWAPQSSGHPVLRSVFFVDTLNGYVVGNGTIIKSTDGGMNWSAQTLDTIGLNSVHFQNATKGYAVGTTSTGHGIILKTTDAGNTWSPVIFGAMTEFYSVHFPDTVNGYCCGYSLNGLFAKTNNGGSTWETVQPDTGSTWYSLYFTNANTGYLCGLRVEYPGGYAKIMKTLDGGLHWSTQLASYPVDYLSSIYFPSADTGYSVGWNGNILKTTNGGSVSDIREQKRDDNKLLIYPDPSPSEITIKTCLKGHFMILSSSGLQILQREISEPKTQIDICTLPSGVYIIRLISESKVAVGRFVKQ